MSVNYQLRPASLLDAPALHQAVWSDKSLTGVTELLQRAEGIARRKRGLGIVAVINGRIVGYAQLTIWPRVGEISDLIVAADQREQGLGSAMILYLVEQARRWPTPKVEIGVAMSNPRALALYRRLGFQDDRVVNLDLGSGPEAVTYLSMMLHP